MLDNQQEIINRQQDQIRTLMDLLECQVLDPSNPEQILEALVDFGDRWLERHPEDRPRMQLVSLDPQ
jgi:hypothetical protein